MKKFWKKKKIKISKKQKLLKIAWAAQKSHLGGGGGPAMDGQTTMDDITEWDVKSLLASSKAR